MADHTTRFTTDPLVLRAASGKLILPADVAARISNFEATSEGSLRTCRRPSPLFRTTSTDTYGSAFYGIFHGRLENSRYNSDVLLLHDSNGLHAYHGWYSETDPWHTLVSSTGTAPITASIGSTTTPQFPTQFALTDRGIVIAPQNDSRAYFYDGETILPLGYSHAPAPPIGLGPETRKAEEPNNQGYNVGRSEIRDEYTLNKDFGYGRLGTANPWILPEDTFGGQLLLGAYQGAVQWIDYFGNFSPISPRSNEITFASQKITGKQSDVLLKAVFWNGIDKGPDGTVARRLLRTRDLRNSGTSELFIVPGNVGFGTISADANMPDNISTSWSDNCPDAWLVAPTFDVRPVPNFKLCRYALGRLWIANTSTHSAEVVPSLPGRYGTFLKGTSIFPDPTGGEITGLWNSNGGLLVFTKSSVFIVTPNDAGDSFRASALSSDIGCVGPGTFANMPDGSTIWLGRGGFYQMTSQGITRISGEIQRKIDRINWLRAKGACALFDPTTQEYRCWLPMDASKENNICLIYDGSGWRQRNGEDYADVCVTQDDRKYLFGAGSVEAVESRNYRPGGESTLSGVGKTAKGVFVIDRGANPEYQHLSSTHTHTIANPYKQAVIETSWIDWGRSKDRRSVKTVYFALRESASSVAEVAVYRDWRKTEVYQSHVTLYSPEDPPVFFSDPSIVDDDRLLGKGVWNRRRPYWVRVDIDAPSCEVYKIRIYANKPIEFLGMVIDEEPKPGSFGARIP